MSAVKSLPERFRLRVVTASEDDIHEAIIHAMTLLVLPPAEFTTFPAGLVELTGGQAAKLYRVGLKRGWPDILCVANGGIYGLEVKRPGGVLSRPRIVRNKRNGGARWVEGQVSTFPRLLAAGFRGIAVVHSVEEAVRTLADFGIPMRAVS
jgi:hypothetical protein